MTRDQATAFVTRYMHSWKAHDVCSLAELYAADAIVISPIFGQLCGRQAIANSYRQCFAAFPDVVMDATHLRFEVIIEPATRSPPFGRLCHRRGHRMSVGAPRKKSTCASAPGAQ